MTGGWRDCVGELKGDWQQARREHPRIVLVVIALFLLTAVAPVAGVIWFLAGLPAGLPDKAAVARIGVMHQATTVFDASDDLAFTVFKEQRIEVPIDAVSPHLLHAILAIEDQRFYDHQGLDILRIGSAAMANIRHLRLTQGASTITQQLARQSFLKPERTWRRKAQELILADRIERSYTKTRILELYLNKVYFGNGLYGVEAASRGYFDKHASELTVAEAALLAGLVKSPSRYAPTVDPGRARSRRNLVLQAMLDAGFVDRAAWQSARVEKVALRDGLSSDDPHGAYFKEQVRIELVERFGWQRVYKGGLRVFSTIDMPMQRAAESVVADALSALDARRQAAATRRAAANARLTPSRSEEKNDNGPPLQAALVALDPVTGSVRALVGGRNFDASHFNRAVQAKRQPGSAFKPFVYAAALEAGFTPATVLDHLDDPIATNQGDWAPADGHSSASSMTLRTALRTSSNRAAVQLLQRVGIPRTVRYAKQLGVGDVPSVPSLALGSGEVTVLSMTAAYAAFANHGLVPRPMLIRRVEDAGGIVLYETEKAATRAISDTTAFLMSTMLADVINAGTGAGARALGFTLPAAGKTGTTNGFNDAWFVGYTTKLVTGVWVGFDQPKTILSNGFAGDVAVPVWAKFMKVATRGDKPEWLTPPEGVTVATVCRVSGKRATDGCQDVETVTRDGTIGRQSMAYPEYFARGTGPAGTCDLHDSRATMTDLAVMVGMDRAEAAPSLPSLSPPPSPPERRRGIWWIFGRRD